MSTMTVPTFSLTSDTPAHRLRRTAAAVRVSFTWWGIHKTLTAEQKEEASSAYAAEVRFLTAGKKLIDSRHEAFRKLTLLRHSISQFWKSLTLPYVEAGVRLIRQSDVEMFVHKMEGFREELTEAEVELNVVYEQIKADARRRLGRLYNSADYPPEVRGLFSVSWELPSVECTDYLTHMEKSSLFNQRQRSA